MLPGDAFLSATTPVAFSRDETVESLVRKHSRMVYRIAYAALRNHQDAEDATQETFLRMVRYAGKLSGVEDHKSWLARIAWRVAVGKQRSGIRKREIALDDSEHPEAATPLPSADDTLEHAQLNVLVEQFIAALPAKLREPLVLSTIQEMSSREIAAALDISDAAVRARLFRARQLLRQKLAGRFEPNRELRR